MIKFFRKIRQRLLAKNNFRKYLLYATGEIVLVVIGILIALSINNWNENRKERLQETVILRQLRTEFKSNLQQLDQKISSKKEAIHSALQLLKYIDFPDLRDKDSIDYHIARTIPYTTFDPVVNDLAGSGDLKIIKNDSLKQKLSYWTSEIADVREDDMSWKEYRNNAYVPFLVAHYQLRTIRNAAYSTNVLGKYLIEDDTKGLSPEIGVTRHPEDYNALLNHPDYEDHLERCFTKNVHALNQSEVLRNRIVEILDLLNDAIRAR
ncbi:DUF6090 family protein [Robiginitalea sp. SC105]|uniref:DUF6090 family protein n=1 Tax=Robiginitalea sp. SC105 TaxID=2762332 RepID=UPI00163A83D2|nr:DUF6090 family protein [Robiginitalea sp. SC105]MBC2838596.1 hypothetical protein [Robiginitalea sp. SC105]